jgi:tetrahydromethanopterin S-methyltransferase subunit D
LVPWQDEQVADIERTPAGVKFAGAKAGAGGGVGAAGAAAGAGVTGLTGAGADAADVAGACANAWLANRSVADRAVMIFMILLVIKVFLRRSMLDAR